MKELVNGRETVTLLVKSADDLLRLSSLAGPGVPGGPWNRMNQSAFRKRKRHCLIRSDLTF